MFCSPQFKYKSLKFHEKNEVQAMSYTIKHQRDKQIFIVYRADI